MVKDRKGRLGSVAKYVHNSQSMLAEADGSSLVASDSINKLRLWRELFEAAKDE
jgi:hypothetical protein